MQTNYVVGVTGSNIIILANVYSSNGFPNSNRNTKIGVAFNVGDI
jgi:hypothetical protein